MGWASGSYLMREVVQAARAAGLTDEQRAAFYPPVIAAFEDNDCDTLYEVSEFSKDPDPVFDAALKAATDARYSRMGFKSE